MTPLRPRQPYCPDRAYLRWVAEYPCLVSFCAHGRSEAAHVRTKRLGHDYGNAVPLCHTHHVEQHQIGIQSFQRKYVIDMSAEAKRLEGLYTPPLNLW